MRGLPPHPYEGIATINANGSGTSAFTQQRKMDRATGRLIEDAAKLAANGTVLEGTSDENSAELGLGTSAASGNSAFGIGTSFAMVTRRRAASQSMSSLDLHVAATRGICGIDAHAFSNAVVA